MSAQILMFTQPNCFSCELMKFFLETREIAFKERDIRADPDAFREMTEIHDSGETPTLVISIGEFQEVIIGFNPSRLDELLAMIPSSDPVPES